MNTTSSLSQTTIEDVKAYWDNRPCNVRHSPQPQGTKAYFDEVEKRRYFVEPHIAVFCDFERWQGKKVLEIGCGIGTDATNFARAGADYTGIELSAESMKLARKNFEVNNLSGRFLECNVELLTEKMPSAEFDLVYSFGVLHHTPDPKKAVQQILQVLKPDGEFRLMLYATHSWKAAMIEGGLDQPEAQFGCPIANTYTKQEVHDLLEGFEVTNIDQWHIFPYIIEKYKNYEYVRQPWFEAMPKAVFDTLSRNLGWHLLITAKPLARDISG